MEPPESRIGNGLKGAKAALKLTKNLTSLLLFMEKNLLIVPLLAKTNIHRIKTSKDCK